MQIDLRIFQEIGSILKGNQNLREEQETGTDWIASPQVNTNSGPNDCICAIIIPIVVILNIIMASDW